MHYNDMHQCMATTTIQRYSHSPGRSWSHVSVPHILREPNSVIVLLFFENLGLNACFVSKKTQAEDTA